MASCPSRWIAEHAQTVVNALSVDKQTTWLIFSSGIDVAATQL
ncbi:MAG: hypothetical protein N838_16190 [Thiohalocapsa sp. PB-PSB1]|nr:MAG: hypothetical protein N838_16190 [Thiohalocapsa sp. PB-PSB1]